MIKLKRQGWLPEYLWGFVPRKVPESEVHGTVNSSVIEDVRQMMAFGAHANEVAKKHGISRALVWMIFHGHVR